MGKTTRLLCAILMQKAGEGAASLSRLLLQSVCRPMYFRFMRLLALHSVGGILQPVALEILDLPRVGQRRQRRVDGHLAQKL